MNEMDRLTGIARQVNIPFDPSTTAGKIALIIRGEKAGEALADLCYVTAMLIKTVPVEGREEIFVHAQHLIRRFVLAGLDQEDE